MDKKCEANHYIMVYEDPAQLLSVLNDMREMHWFWIPLDVVPKHLMDKAYESMSAV